MTVSLNEITEAHANADLIFSRQQVDKALDEIASAITVDAADSNPILMCVMNGGLIPMGMLLPRLQFPLRVDYLHASRYRERTFGTNLQWKKTPELPIEGETVIIVDDILDQGYTLEAVVQSLQQAGASRVLSVVLIEKEIQQDKPAKADYVGLLAPDRYLYGYGMDYKGFWRNADGIYAIKDEEKTT